ncbi:hypothetical protein Hanom_Chr13g01194111 [Helianthus anomalus]
MTHVVPPLYRFMNFDLDPELFYDQNCMSICEGFFRGAGMLQKVNELRSINKGLLSELKTSQTIAAKLRCRVIDAERKLFEKENVGAQLEQNERAWERERGAWLEEKEGLLADVKHYKEVASVSGANVETLYADWGMAMDENQKLARERHLLISQGFGLFLSGFSQPEEFKGNLERLYTRTGTRAISRV